MTKKTRVKLSNAEIDHVGVVAHAVSEKIIASEGLRLALPIARKVHEQVIASYKRIEARYGRVD